MWLIYADGNVNEGADQGQRTGFQPVSARLDGVTGSDMLQTASPRECRMTKADTLPILERRRIEATILKHVYETLKASHGIEAATRTVAEAVRRSSIEQAAQLAAEEPGDKTSLRTFIDRQAQWRAGDALRTETIRESDLSSTSMSPAAGMRKCIATWASARSATFSPASATAPFVKATTPA